MVLNLDAGFVSSYPTSATTWYDLSYSGNNGTLINGPTFNSLSGGSIVFDGTDDYTNFVTTLPSSTIYSVSSWFYTDTGNWNGALFGFGTNESPNTQDVYLFGNAPSGCPSPIGGSFGFNTWNCDSFGIGNASTLLKGTGFHHVVATFNHQNVRNNQLWLDGVLQPITQQIGTTNFSANLNNQFKIASNGWYTAEQLWRGRVSNLQAYTRLLSPFEVYQNYNAMKGRFGIPDIVTSGLTLNLDAGNPYSYNPLNTGSTNWTDISGYGNNGVLTNGAFYSGGTMVFDGVNDYSLTTNPSILQSQNLTLSVWIKPNTATNVITGIVDYDHAQGQGWVLQSEDATTNRNYYFAYFDGVTFQPSTGISVGKGIKITNFEWQNLVFVKSGTSITGYFNGSQIYQSTAGSGNISYQPNKNLGIANVISINGRQYRGSISNVQVYNRPISPFEVYQNFNSLKNRYGFSDIVTEGLILNLDAGNPY
jgi:hypothetical protein